MRRLLVIVLTCAALNVPTHAQNIISGGPELETILNFEAEHTGTTPRGWSFNPPGTIAIDGDVVHGGRWSVRLARTATSPQMFSSLVTGIPVEFAGTTLELRGYLRSENVSGYMALYMGQDGDGVNLGFTSMEPQQIKGTNDWKEYAINFPLHRDARQLYFGAVLNGTGTLWADDLRLLVDGKPVWTAPRVERPKTPLDLDHQFDSGSGIVISELSTTQIENLARLGKVWGFLKYHHPVITSGMRHWDYELFRVLPAILAARDRAAGDRVMHEWASRLDMPPPCDQCVTPADENVHLRLDLRWIDALTPDLAGLLRAVHRGRSRGPQFYVSQNRGVGNPRIDHELPYAAVKFPDAAISCSRSTGSGTSSNTGFPTETSWMRIGTRSLPNSSRGWRSPGITRISWTRSHSSPESLIRTRICGARRRSCAHPLANVSFQWSHGSSRAAPW